jgi:membrane-bound lytic murein transglycosylase D
MTIMAKNPSQYGLDHLALDPPFLSDTVRIHYPIDLRLVAECTDSSAAVLQQLNPSVLRMTTPRDLDFDLHLPAGTAERYQKTVEAVPEEMRVYWRYHHVESGENLAEIARRYHTTAAAIAEANNLKTNAVLEPESRLIIPVSPARSAPKTDRISYSKRPTRYTVHKGDTVLSVADDFGVPAEKVRQWNRLQGNALVAGRSLTIYKPLASGEAAPAARSGRTPAHRSPAHPGSSHKPASKAPAKTTTAAKKHKQQS